MSPPEVNPRALLRYSLTLLSRRDSHPVISRNPGPLRIADLAGLLGDRVDPSQVPSQTRVMTRCVVNDNVQTLSDSDLEWPSHL